MAEHHLFGAHGRKEAADTQGQTFLDKRLEYPVRIPPFFDQTCTFQNAEMPRDRRGADSETASDFPSREFPCS